MLGHDVSSFDPDGPLPDIPESNASQSARERVVDLARKEGLTIRELAARAGSYSGLAFVGTPQSIADEMQAWLEESGSDGFNMMFPWVPAGLEDFTDLVVPELQRRGIFRKGLCRNDAARPSRPRPSRKPLLRATCRPDQKPGDP